MWFLLIALTARAALPTGLMLTSSMAGDTEQQGPLSFCPGHSGSAELISALEIEQQGAHHTDSGTQYCSFSSSGLNHGLELGLTLLGEIGITADLQYTQTSRKHPSGSYLLLPSRAPPLHV